MARRVPLAREVLVAAMQNPKTKSELPASACFSGQSHRALLECRALGGTHLFFCTRGPSENSQQDRFGTRSHLVRLESGSRAVHFVKHAHQSLIVAAAFVRVEVGLGVPSSH